MHFCMPEKKYKSKYKHVHVSFTGIFIYNYNCHNIYWDPLIWLVENGHLIALTCVSFFNEPGPYSWGAGPFRGPFTSELLLWYCAMKYVMLLWREMDSLRLLAVYLTLTPIFSGRKAKIDLHMMPKLTVVMPISCLLRSIQFPSPQNDAITPGRSPLAHVLDLYVFSRAPQWNRFLNLLTVAWFIQHFLQFVFAFSSHSIKMAQFLFAGAISFPFQAISTESDDASVTNVNEWRHIRWRNYRTHSNEDPCRGKNEILVSKM